MRIAVNTRMLIQGKLDGIGWFSHEVLQRLVTNNPQHEFLFLFDREFSENFIYADNVWAKVLFPQARHPLLYRMYFEYSIPKAIKQWKADLFFSPDGFLSTRTRIPQVPVIHDLNFEHRPQDLPKAYSNYYRSYFPRFAQKARNIITVSEYSAKDIATTYGIEPEKISVAHNGCNKRFRPLTETEIKSIRAKHVFDSEYFVFVGSFSYRKNIHGIINAYELYRNTGGSSKLVMIGNPLWRYNEMDDALAKSNYAEDIIFLGHLPLDELVKVTGAANALLFPSYFEGFGIPIIEAFGAGIPVICANTTSLPEVAGDAALYADPDDHAQISKHMLEVEKNNLLREKLVKSGFEQKNKFTWDNTANKVEMALFTY